jgi:SNF2 family DNA or RNA helicase
MCHISSPANPASPEPLNPKPCEPSAGEDIIGAAGKMGVLDRLLGKLHARGHRVTLFSQYNRMLDIVEDYLNMRGYR